MQATLLPVSSGAYKELYESEPNTVILAKLVEKVDETMSPVGTILSGMFQRYHLVFERVAATQKLYTFPSDLEGTEVYAFEENCLNLNAGDKYVMRLVSSTSDDLLGAVMTDSVTMMNLQFAMEEDCTSVGGEAKRQRSNLKLITLANGRQLGRDKTIKAICKWLDKYNSQKAGVFGIKELVWCEEVSVGSRNQRSWWYYDTVVRKRKPFANATAAVEYMENITQTDCYAEIIANPEIFVVD